MNQSGAIDQGVDWSAPWLAAVRDIGIQVAASTDWRDELNRKARSVQLCNHRQLPIRFVKQQELPADVSYEAFISDRGCVPSRDNLHDFFNALVWLTFPSVKMQLNALQAAQIARLGIGKSRGPSRDAATLFDENAALLAVTDNDAGRALVQSLRSHQWHEVFVVRRETFALLADVFLFGHAIMEKLVQPYKAITAHTMVCWVDADFHSKTLAEKKKILDVEVARRLINEELLPAIFSPLPVLGVPLWWPKQDVQFYADASVFRPQRQR